MTLTDRLAEALRGFLNEADEDCGDAGCEDCEAWRPIRELLAEYDRERGRDDAAPDTSRRGGDAD